MRAEADTRSEITKNGTGKGLGQAPKAAGAQGLREAACAERPAAPAGSRLHDRRMALRPGCCRDADGGMAGGVSRLAPGVLGFAPMVFFPIQEHHGIHTLSE